MIRPNEDNLLRVVVIGSSTLALVLSLASLFLFSRPMGLGIAAGAGIAVVNFIWQRSIMQRALGLQLHRPAAYVVIRYLLRLGLTAILLYWILTSGLFSLAGLLVGLSVVVIMIVLCTVYFTLHLR